MKFALWIVAGSLLLAGCSKATPDASTASSSGNTSGASSLAIPAGSNSADASQTANSSGPTLTLPGSTDAQPAKVVSLTPANTRIQFVGTHVGPKPDPMARVGTFQQFSGQAVLAEDFKSLQSVAVDIQTGSLQTQMGKLTNHLNTEDFLDTRSHPTATFKSTRITKDDQGKTQILGDFTLHGVTKEIAFPADVTIDNNGLALKAEFTIDRTHYDMDRMLDRVEKPVAITVIIGNTADAAE